ncbi:hypothetical protein HK105_205540 [Polyrhizophydium stewartii]|uniref:Ankyrin repeat protein n=1 Tax=Polyrhizophydium stewartii TaxID=2732419 RepID=A0ABR4N628_9FUNG
MLVRLLELDNQSNRFLYTAALINHWEDALKPYQRGRPELAATMSGRMDILRNLFEAGKLFCFDPYCIANALAFGHLEMFNWFVKHTRHKAPNLEIFAILLDPSIHELLKDPPRSFFGRYGRTVALICPESDLGDPQETRAPSTDPIALEILFRRFGFKIDFAALNIDCPNVELLEWAHSRGLIRDKAFVAQNIARFAETANVAEWACKHLSFVFEQRHLDFACSQNNGVMTAWLLRQPGIVVDHRAIGVAIGNFAFECIDVFIAHDPLVAETVVVAAVQVDAAVLEVIKENGFGVSLTELLDWLYLRHPSGFTPHALVHAIGVALQNEMHEFVAFLLKSVTTVDWDLVVARQMVEESNASRKFKKKLRLLIDKCAARRASSL